MRAGVWRDAALAMEEWPAPKEHEERVIVQVAYCGFCGSDAAIVSGKLDIGAAPQLLGHEVSGTITHVGEKVKGLRIGDRVACNLYGQCMACDACRSGRINLCTRKWFAANGFAEFASYRPDQIFVLPDSVSLKLGAWLEPVATVLHAVDDANILAGESVLILGGGALGQVASQLARLSGAGTVVVSEPYAHKRALAVALGATAAIDPAIAPLAEQLATQGLGAGVDVVLDFAGYAPALAEAINVSASRGRIVIVAVYSPDETVPVNPFNFYERETLVRGSYSAPNTFLRALRMLPLLRLEELVTERLALADIDRAMDRHKDERMVKLVISP